MTKKELIKKLNEFKDLFNDLSETLQQFDYNGKDCNDYICENYPFDKSFDDLNSEVTYWVETCIERLEEE